MTTISTPSLLTDGTTLFIGGSWRSDIKAPAA